MVNNLIRRADAVITPSTDTAERWVQTAGPSRDRVSVIPTGVDTNHFVPITSADRHEQRRTLGIGSDVPMVLDAGRVDPTKGLHYLFEALRQLPNRVSLVVCGSGTDGDFVRSLHEDFEDLDITWLDRRPDVSPLLAAADLVVLPSLVPETQGMVVIEAMSCGTPAGPVSRAGGLPRNAGRVPDHLAASGDGPALAAAIDHLVDWRRHSPDLGADSCWWVADHLALDRSIAAISTVLAGLGG